MTKATWFPYLVAVTAIISCGQPQNESAILAIEPVPASDICITDLEGNFGSGAIALHGLSLTATCKSNQEMANFFEGYSVALGVASALCVIPGPHSVGMPVFAAGSIATGVISFTIKNLPCEGGTFSEADEEAIDRRICKAMGKTFKKGAGENGENLCQ